MGSSSTEGRQIETIESGKTSMGDKNSKKSTVIMVLYGIIWYYHVLPENYHFEDIYNFRQIPLRSDSEEILTVFFAQDDHGGSA